jgi:hypothetical protein
VNLLFDREMAKRSLITGLEQGKRLEVNAKSWKKRIIENGKDYSISSVGDVSFELNKMKYPLSSAYLLKYLTFDYIEEYCNDIVEEYMLLADNKQVVRSFVHLRDHNIKEVIQLDDGIIIRPICEVYLNYLINEDDYYAGIHNTNGLPSDALMSGHLDDPFGSSILILELTISKGEKVDWRSIFGPILTSFILSTGVSPSFNISPIYTFSVFGGISQVTFMSEFQTANHYVHRKWLKKINSSEIVAFYNLLKLNKHAEIQLAINRYISAFAKADTGDKIIDLVIALESLYPSVKSENTYRISIMTAIALGQGYELFEIVKRIYGERSEIVHGNVSKNSSKTIKEATVIVRKLVFIYLSRIVNGENVKGIERCISKEIFGNDALSVTFFDD